MPQVFNDLIEITGAGDQALELTCTGGQPSRVQLLAVNSNQLLEGQIQFLGQFSLTGIPGTPSNPDGQGPALTYLVPSGDLRVSGKNDQRIHLLCTSGQPSHVQLLAVNSNQRLEGQLQFLGQFSLTGIPGTPSNPDGQGPALAYLVPSGKLTLLDSNGNTRITLDVVNASVFSGDVEVTGNLSVTGDISLTNGDCAEDFDIAKGTTAEPGSVMVIDQDGALTESHTAYDRKVVGVISGAGDYNTGIILDRQSRERSGRMPIALNGKVYCKVDAGYNPIGVGDLLVTSPTLAHAMKASRPEQAFGAVIGKALRRLESGRGLIPILVSLQ